VWKKAFMGLSDEERRRLRELEEELYAEDPALARKLGRNSSLNTSGTRKVYGLLAVVAGFAVLVAGVTAQLTVVGVLGFLLVCAGAYIFLGGYRWQGWPK
jgi:uncharacterized membrane protein HdeD (DUF308 family)